MTSEVPGTIVVTGRRHARTIPPRGCTPWIRRDPPAPTLSLPDPSQTHQVILLFLKSSNVDLGKFLNMYCFFFQIMPPPSARKTHQLKHKTYFFLKCVFFFRFKTYFVSISIRNDQPSTKARSCLHKLRM